MTIKQHLSSNQIQLIRSGSHKISYTDHGKLIYTNLNNLGGYAIIVPKKIGNSVERHHIKRVMRMAFFEGISQFQDLKNLSFIIYVNHNVSKKSYNQLKLDYQRVLENIK